MFEKVLLTGKNEETLLPRVLRVLSKQGAQVRTLHMDCRGADLSLEIELEGAAAAKWPNCWRNKSPFFPLRP